VQPDPGSLAALGFSDDELRATAREAIGAGADATVPDEARFCRSVVWLIRKRLHVHGDQSESNPAVFLLCTAPPTADGQQPPLVPMLSTGMEPLTGRLWFVSPLCNSGKYHELGTWDDDAEVFRLITDELQLGDVTAIIFDPRPDPAEVRYYPQGLAKHDECQRLYMTVGQLDINDVLEKIGQVHEHSLVTPTALGRGRPVWRDAKKHIVADNAEHVIQGCLQASLQQSYPSCTVRTEQPQPSGRVDLEIEEPEPDDASRVTRHALLELKVLRSFNSAGTSKSAQTTKNEIDEGVRQAKSYRDEKGTRAAALCCFDMRVTHTGDGCFSHVRKIAREWNVALGVWPLFASAQARRDYTTGKPRAPSARSAAS
jgi:hypothetical protein